MTATPTPDLRVLCLMYPGFDSVDMMGPRNAMASCLLSQKHVEITTAGADEATTTWDQLTVTRTLSFDALLATPDAMADYDVLLVPGAEPEALQAVLNGDGKLVEIIQRFSTLAPPSVPKATTGKGNSRWLLSVCTGAIFVGAAGLLAGRTATTHWQSLDTLREACAKAAEQNGTSGDAKSATKIVRSRFVDTGVTASGTHIITSGGVSCGIDAALWVISEIWGMEAAREVAGSMDVNWVVIGPEATSGFVVP